MPELVLVQKKNNMYNSASYVVKSGFWITYRVNYPQADTKLLVVVVGDVMSMLPNPLLYIKNV